MKKVMMFTVLSLVSTIARADYSGDLAKARQGNLGYSGHAIALPSNYASDLELFAVNCIQGKKLLCSDASGKSGEVHVANVAPNSPNAEFGYLNLSAGKLQFVAVLGGGMDWDMNAIYFYDAQPFVIVSLHRYV